MYTKYIQPKHNLVNMLCVLDYLYKMSDINIYKYLMQNLENNCPINVEKYLNCIYLKLFSCFILCARKPLSYLFCVLVNT